MLETSIATPHPSQLQVSRMIYTEQRDQGKSLRDLSLSVRLWFVRAWLRFFGPRWTAGALCILRDSQGRVCLLKHRGRLKPWGLPGGLISWPESPEQGLLRELHEELSWRPTPRQRFLVQECLTSEKFPLLEIVFAAETPLSPEECIGWVVQVAEIEEVSWMSLDDIEALDGILERHRRMLVHLLRRP